MRKIWYFLRINYRFLILGIFFSLGGYFFWQQQLQPLLRSYRRYYFSIGLVGNYTLNSLPPEVAGLISEGLTQLTKSGNATSGAAQRWTVNDGGLKYTFYLRRNLRWHDGKLFEAKDIHYKIAPAKAKIIAKNIIQFQLPEPFAPFLTAVSQPLFRKQTIGLGKYRVAKLRFRRGDIIDKLTLIAKGKTFPRQITFHFYPTQKDLQNAFLLGEIKEARGFQSIGFLKKWPHLKITPRQTVDRKYTAIFFNTAKSPFDNKRFRQALAYAIHKPVGETRALTPISPLSWAYNRNVKTYAYNLPHARQVLRQAKVKLPRSFILLTTVNLLDTAEQIRKDWQKLGINVQLQVANNFFLGKDFDAFLGYGFIPPDPDQYYFWHSQQQGNICYYHDVRVDTLLEKGRRTLVKEGRRRIYLDFQRFLVEDAPAIFLSYPETYTVQRLPAIRL